MAFLHHRPLHGGPPLSLSLSLSFLQFLLDGMWRKLAVAYGTHVFSKYNQLTIKEFILFLIFSGHWQDKNWREGRE